MANDRREDGLDYVGESPPEPGNLIEVSSGIYWVRMPLPMALDHINLWLIEDTDTDGSPAWTIVDTGMGTGRTREIWQNLLDGPAASRKPIQLIATHYHPDHCGLAGWLCETYGLRFRMTEGEWMIASLLWRVSDQDYSESQDAFFTRYGVSRDVREFHKERGNEYRNSIGKPPPRFDPIRNGETVTIGGRAWTVITCGGHTTDHACLYCREAGVLISGDQVLPQISPIISVWWYKDGLSPLPDYLEGLARLKALPEDTLVLPSHRQPFRGLHRRIDQLSRHHDDRLNDLRRGIAAHGSLSTVEAAGILFPRPLDPMNMLFAAGETIAHLEHLVRTGEVEKAEPTGQPVSYRAVRPGGAVAARPAPVEEIHF